ncbi:hypothetical protein EB118_10920 [bacterium]|nr:hypothetical protein [Actinomycetota bacterium]NDG30567.1 hypothetical protein [bacterium]
MYSWIPYIIIFTLLAFVIIHAYMSFRYGYDWIGSATRKMAVRYLNSKNASIVDLYPIPRVPYMDRFGQYTKIPKMKENSF